MSTFDTRFDVRLFVLISILVIFVVLLLIYRISSYYRNRLLIRILDLEKKHSHNKKVCILLTMYIGDPEDLSRNELNSVKDKEERKTYMNREKHYRKICKKWLQNTKIPIYIVDSSGRYLFENSEYPNLHQFTFKQEEKRKRRNPSMKEKDSIEKIIDCNFEGIAEHDFVYKITGKYFIDNFERICIDCLPCDADYILQNNTLTNGQNTELIGFKPSLTKELLSDISPIKNFESVARDLIYNHPNRKIYRLPQIYIDNDMQRSDGTILKSL